jgi:hypothetical protein
MHIVAGLLAQTALTGVLRAHSGSKAAMLFAAALMAHIDHPGDMRASRSLPPYPVVICDISG